HAEDDAHAADREADLVQDSKVHRVLSTVTEMAEFTLRGAGDTRHRRTLGKSRATEWSSSPPRHHTRGSLRSKRKAVPVAAASSRSSCSPNGNVVISSSNSACPASALTPSPLSRKLPFSTAPLNAATRAA